MSASNATISIFIWAHLSPLAFLHHLFYLGLLAYLKEQPFALMFNGIVVLEDDMDIPHPPGYFTPLSSYQGIRREVTFDDSSNTSGDISSADDTLLSITGDTSSADTSIAVLMSKEVDSYSGLIISSSLSEITAPDSTKEILASESPYAVSAAVLSSDLEPSSPTLVFGLSEAPFSDCHEDALHFGGEQLQPPVVSDDIQILRSLDSLASLDITEQHSNTSSDPGPDSDSHPSPLPTLTTPPPEFVELDMTDEGGSIIKNPHIHTISAFVQSKDPDTRPEFSRHNINDQVVFPVRKLSSSSGSTHPRSFSESVNLGHISASLTMANEEIKKRNSINRTSTTLLTSLFTGVGEDAQARSLPEKDQYDSWPWIRDAIEQDVAQEEGGEGEQSNSVIDLARGIFGI